MLDLLLVESGKFAPQVVATAAIKRGTPLDGGKAFAWVEKNYDGVNAVIDPLWTESDEIAVGQIYTKYPTREYERYGTTELTPAGLSEGNALVVTGDKFVKAGTSTPYEWIYKGSYTAYGVTMYEVERVPAATTAG